MYAFTAGKLTVGTDTDRCLTPNVPVQYLVQCNYIVVETLGDGLASVSDIRTSDISSTNC